MPETLPLGPLFASTALAVAALMGSLWALSLALRDASLVDLVWGPGFALIAWVAFLETGSGEPARRLLLATLVSLWGLRLGAHLAIRNVGKGEDFRYVHMRQSWGRAFPWVSAVTVFGLQGSVMWVVSLPVQIGQAAAVPPVGALDALGTGLWAVGFAFEVIGDAQLARFRRDPANRGRVLDSGLWRYTRHPNYFGDCLMWWGLFVIAFAVPRGAWSALGPAVMTVFLLRISGVAMLERSLIRRHDGYASYQARTSAFIPLPPRR